MMRTINPFQLILTLSLFIVTLSPVYGQSPGGVNANLRLWLKADAGVTNAGGFASAWADQSGNALNATQGTAANRPAILTTRVNFNPSLQFTTASSTQMLITGGIVKTATYSNVHLFAVARTNIVSPSSLFYETQSAGGRMNVHLPWSDNNIYWDAGSTVAPPNRLSSNWGGTTGVPYLWSFTASTTATPSGARQDIYRNGLRIATDNNMASFTGNNSTSTIGSLNAANFYTGEVSELIVYNGVMTLSQFQQIQSYLAVKYGVTLDQATPTDYVSSAGTVIWNAGANSVNKFNITGIGRDAGSALDQRKSKSTNTGSVLTIEKTTPGSAFTDDQSFLVISDDNGSLSGTASGVPAGAPAFSSRVSRVWRAEVTGNPGTISVSFDLGTGIRNSGVASDYTLLVANSSDFSTTAPIAGGNLSSGIITFTNVSLSNGDYFTLTVPSSAPGGVSNNLRLWLKADASVTDAGGFASAWFDQSDNTLNATQATAANRPAILPGSVNFNSSLRFTAAANTRMLISGGIVKTATYNDIYLFAIARTNIISNSALFFETLAAGGQFTISTPLGNSLTYWDAGGATAPNRLSVNWGGTTGVPYLWNYTASTTVTPSGALQDIYRNGLRIATDNDMAPFTGNNSTATIGSAGGGNFYNGDISELIAYNGAMTLSQFQQIQSYLAIKYGLTLDQATPTDYVSSAGTVIWNAGVNSVNQFNITGIGRDAGSALDQRKSKSTNTGSVLTIEKTTPGSAFAVDQNFLIVADDNATLTGTTNGVPTAFPAFPKRVKRVWRTSMTGNPGTVSVSFDLGTGIYNSGIASDYALLTGNSNDFSAATPITGGTLSAGVITFENVSLSDGDYFTLGQSFVPAPGGISENLRLWLKADAGVTDVGGFASAWSDQSGHLPDATQGTAANRPAIIPTRANFNPSLQFTAANSTQLSIAGGMMKTATYTNYHLFAVARTNIVSAGIVFGETGASGGQLALSIPYIDNLTHWDAGIPNASNSLSANWGGATGTPYVWSYLASTTATPSGALQDIYRNGLRIATDNTMTSFAGNNSPTIIGSFTGSRYYNGELSELIAYDGVMTLSQFQQIQSYLAIKYGVTLDQTTPTNYVSSLGTVVWNATANGTNKFNITGIGRDDGSLLDQRKSKGLNTGALVTIEKTTPGTSFIDDQSFLVVADDNATLTGTTSGVPTGFPAFPKRVKRLWRAHVTGNPGTVSISFDVSTGMYNSGVASDYVLLAGSSSDFSAVTPITGGVLSGGVITFENVTLSNGDYFTLGHPFVPGPGGVSENLRLWLRADAGVTDAGGFASVWTDQSGNALNATQGTAANRPAILASRVNFNPALQFTPASSTRMLITAGIVKTSTVNDIHLFAMTRANAVLASAVFSEPQSGAGGQLNVYIPWNNNIVYWYAGRANASNLLSANWGGAIGTPYLWSFTASTTGTPSGALQDIYRNGFRLATDNTMTPFTGNNSNSVIGANGSTNFFNGEISELIAYNGAMTLSQFQQVQSYLAIKYGVTLDQTIPTDYVSSFGTVVWDAAANGADKFNITGIGRDDGSLLDQRKSRTLNANAVITLEKTTPGSAFTADQNFLVIADDNGTLTGTNSGVPTGFPAFARRVRRVWRTTVTGTPGTVSISFDLAAGIRNSGVPSDYALLIAGSADFSAATPITGGTMSSSVITFTNVSLSDGDYFTLSIPHSAPGGVANNLRLWLKADADVTNTGGYASAWYDQSGHLSDATQGTAANRPAIIPARVNFNPSLQFTAANSTRMSITGGIVKTATYNDIHLFAIARTNTVSNGSFFFESLSASGQLLVRTPWGDNVAYWDAGQTVAPNRLSAGWGGTTGVPYLWSFTASTTGTPSGARQDIYRNGLRIATDNNMVSFTGNNSTTTIGSVNASNFYNGELSELTVYNGAMTLSQFQRIQSYMAIKYGITLDQTAPSNYVASDGTILWNAAVAGSYKNNIVAIGRDDDSELDQKQSKNGNTSNIIVISNGSGPPSLDNETNTNTFSDDKSFLSWSDNNLAVSSKGVTDIGTSTNGEIIKARVARAWLAQKTGTVGTVSLLFNMAGVPGVGNVPGANDLANVRLLVDADGTFASGALSVAPTFFDNTVGVLGFEQDFQSSTGYYFTLGSTDLSTTPLPIELLSFRATPQNNRVQLVWETASETNNDYFTVQSSRDAKAWRDVIQVKGKGTTKEKSTYYATDETPYSGRSFYRLMQVDIDGTLKYSSLQRVDIEASITRLYPNPTPGIINLEFSTPEGVNKASVQVMDTHGRLVYAHVFSAEPAQKSVAVLNLENLPDGEYLARTVIGNDYKYHKIIVKR